MLSKKSCKYEVHNAYPKEYAALGQMTVEVYSQLPGMPSVDEQPDYYSMLLDVAGRASNPAIKIFTATTQDGELLGGVTFSDHMEHYGSGGTAGNIPDASGIRLLAVKPEARGLGVGKSLTEACIQRAISLGKSEVVLHTTKSMKIAWAMYERMGFKRSKDIDFKQGDLDVYGFCLSLNSN